MLTFSSLSVGMSLSTNETTQIPIFFTSLLGIGFAPILILLGKSISLSDLFRQISLANIVIHFT